MGNLFNRHSSESNRLVSLLIATGLLITFTVSSLVVDAQDLEPTIPAIESVFKAGYILLVVFSFFGCVVLFIDLFLNPRGEGRLLLSIFYGAISWQGTQIGIEFLNWDKQVVSVVMLIVIGVVLAWAWFEEWYQHQRAKSEVTKKGNAESNA